MCGSKQSGDAGRGFSGGLGTISDNYVWLAAKVCWAVRSRRNSSSKTRTVAAKPDRIVRLVLSASLHLYLCQLCRVRLSLEQEEFLLQAISGTVGCFLSEGEFPRHQKRVPATPPHLSVFIINTFNPAGLVLTTVSFLPKDKLILRILSRCHFFVTLITWVCLTAPLINNIYAKSFSTAGVQVLTKLNVAAAERRI